MDPYSHNPTRQELTTLLGKQIKELREKVGMTYTEFGELLTRVAQADRTRKEKTKGYWIGLSYLPIYLKRWETGNHMPNWNDLVVLKRIADAYEFPFDLPVDAAPVRIRKKLAPGNYLPESPLYLADIPQPIPPMQSGRAYGKRTRIRKWRRPNPCPICGR